MSNALDTAAVALRGFVHRSGALRAQALLPHEPPALVSCTRLGPLEILVGERSVSLPHDVELDARGPELAGLRALPPFDVSVERGEVAGVIGGIDMLVEAMRTIAAALDEGTVVVAELETTTPDVPLVLTVRLGEEPLVTLGDESFSL